MSCPHLSLGENQSPTDHRIQFLQVAIHLHNSQSLLLEVIMNLTAVTWVRAQVNPVGFVVDKAALGQVFLQVLRFSRQYHSTMDSKFPKIKKKSSFTHSSSSRDEQ
jgi:hypothetical protein